MKQIWSKSWAASKQPRKQRKYRANAPLHVKHKFLGAHLTKALRESVGRRALPLRKGDEVIIVRGGKKGQRGTVDRADLKSGKIYLDNLKVKKKDGTEVAIPLSPSNLIITKLNTDDKMRKIIIQRKKGAKTPAEEKPAKKPEKEAPAEKKPEEVKK